ncbi:glyoxalase superfamily protein [uncultured Ramlibacter sp.]|uniref:glyoxalase superfamily protein n=1 Tax=uncultured Ramlibacter sp. TaxID=260755 RepID=UPI002625040D|nr:glyoxalase superfamily protein [uncultured Ramlibacter sp.]
MSTGRVIPVLRIFDAAKALEFYRDFLGFKVDWEHRFEDGLPLYMQVSHAGCLLHLSEHFGDACPGAQVRIETEGLPAYQEQLLAKQYKNARPGLVEVAWGGHEMRLTDPFGNRLSFHGPMEES